MEKTLALIQQIKDAQAALVVELDATATGNKSAARRARKITLDFGKLLNDFRKFSNVEMK